MKSRGNLAVRNPVHRPPTACGAVCGTTRAGLAVTLISVNKNDGFTLIELVVTMSVAAILVAIAVPSFSNMMASNRLTAVANDFVMSASEARLEAIRRNSGTQLCAASGNGSTTLGTACGSTNTGAVFALASDPDDDPVQIRAAPALNNLNVVASKPVFYSGQGLGREPGETAPYTGLIVDLYSDRLSTANHRCVYLTTGSSLQTCSSDTACNASTVPANC